MYVYSTLYSFGWWCEVGYINGIKQIRNKKFIPKTFNNSNIACFSNKKYNVPIQTRTKQF